MSMRDERHDDAFDELIGSVAKALTASEPTRALRSGVRERIGRRGPAWSPTAAWAFAAATVLAVVFAGWNFMRPVEDGRPARPAPARATSVPPRQPALETTPSIGQTAESRAPQEGLAAAVAPPMEEESPLIPPITIEPLSTTRIAVNESSEVMPIEIEPLQIEPLQLSGQ
jgi:hypothetical protein